MATYRVSHFLRNVLSVSPIKCHLNSFSLLALKGVPSSFSPDIHVMLVQQSRPVSHSASHFSPMLQGQQLQRNETASICEEDPYKVESEKCILCKYQVPVSYKNVQLLSQFVSPNTGRIFGRHITRLCQAQQRRVTKAIKRAIQMGYMPNQHRETRFLKDPSLYDVRYSGSPSIGQYTNLPDSNLSQEELLEMKNKPQAESNSPQAK